MSKKGRKKYDKKAKNGLAVLFIALTSVYNGGNK